MEFSVTTRFISALQTSKQTVAKILLTETALEAAGNDGQRYLGIDRRHGTLESHPWVAVEIAAEYLLGRSRGDRIDGERGIRTADGIGERRAVGHEQTLDPARLAALVEH